MTTVTVVAASNVVMISIGTIAMTIFMTFVMTMVMTLTVMLLTNCRFVVVIFIRTITTMTTNKGNFVSEQTRIMTIVAVTTVMNNIITIVMTSFVFDVLFVWYANTGHNCCLQRRKNIIMTTLL